ncbi:MAG: OmpA family protein [Cytophagales bacterium]|nr:OmpA family protein [Cytophagales bacterium]
MKNFLTKINKSALLILLPAILHAQDEKAIKRLQNEAKEHFRIEEFNNALPLFLQLDSIFPNNPEYNYGIGVCYLNSNYKSYASHYLEAAKNLSNVPGTQDGQEGLNYSEPELNYYLGKAYHFDHHFDKAVKTFQEYIQTLNPDDHERMEEVNRYIGQCHVGKKLVANPLNVTIKNIGKVINSRYADYVPVISADETMLLFTSRRDNTTGGVIDEVDNQYFEDIYLSYNENDQWSEPQNLPINTNTHDACIALSPDGHKLFTYKPNVKRGARSGDIYESELTGKEWSTPKRLEGEVNSKGWEPSCSISANEKKLYFSSDRPGGYGGRDIYVSKKLPDGTWAKPINIGPKINTPYDEDAPFIHPDGKTLYFSSKGHEGMGGFDIFTSIYPVSDNLMDVQGILSEDTLDWSDPLNIGYPINTAGDDIYFVWSADGKRGYFSSVREDSYGDKDIYMVYRPEAKVALIVFKGRVLDADAQNPIGANIIVMNNTDQELFGIYNSNSYTGRFTIILQPNTSYGINIEAHSPGYLFYSENIDIPQLDEYLEVDLDILLEPIEVGKKIILRNIFFDYNKSEIRSESEAELNRLLKLLTENPALKVQLSGHTDNIGSHEYNMELSQARADSVVEHLIKAGIEKERLEAVGYGETKPIAPNENPDGSDNPEGRQLNRRTEFEIIDILKK